MKLAYSPEAIADLIRLRAFIATHDPGAAARIGKELVTRIESLSTFPHMGRPVSQAPDPESIRDFIFGKYIVRYMVHGSALVVLRIWHHYETRQSGT